MGDPLLFLGCYGHSASDLSPSDQSANDKKEKKMNIKSRLETTERRFLPPMFLHSAAEGDLLAHFGANGIGQADLGQIGLDGKNAAAG